MKNRIIPTVETSGPSDVPINQKLIPCRICGAGINPPPNFVYQIFNQTKSGCLFIQLCNHGQDKGGKPVFAPVAVCIPCIQNIVGAAARAVLAANEQNPEESAPAPDIEPPAIPGAEAAGPEAN